MNYGITLSENQIVKSYFLTLRAVLVLFRNISIFYALWIFIQATISCNIGT